MYLALVLRHSVHTLKIIGIISVWYLGCGGMLFGQEVSIDVSYDTVYAENIVAVRYAMENWQAEMDQPEFGDFEVVGGPQISSSMSISGGQKTSSKTVIMFLKPPAVPGEYILPPITFRGEGKKYKTKEKSIIVVANPENLRQEPAFDRPPPKTFDRQYKRSEPPRGKRQRF